MSPRASGRPQPDSLPLGATVRAGGQCDFLVWAPKHERVEVHITEPVERILPMQPLERGYHHALVDDVQPGALYKYRLSGDAEWPDPASRLQPHGVHGPSQIVNPHFRWTDSRWRGLPLEKYVIYELHAGTFTPQGTFDAIIPRLDELKALGVTAIELMPVAQFPGGRNWGYDGVYPFATQNSYGGPAALKNLVNECHRRGMAVVLDVVYNHLGPEGNYFGQYGPYFTDRYCTPWGEAMNFDGAHCDEVRRCFIENALTWITEFHIDALRLDAIHAIVDSSAVPFLQELGTAVHQRARELRRHVYLFPESDLNDSRAIRPVEQGGYGLDSQWNDDFHHSLHALLTGERDGYYADFGTLQHLATAFQDGYVYAGQYSVFRRRRHGNSTRDLPPPKFIVCTQHHDQVGNRCRGERLAELVDFESLKLAAAAMILSPYLPLLFMGEEYAETSPFLYFTSHGDPALIEAVCKGRREEFAHFNWKAEVPDPHDEATFTSSRLHWDLRDQGRHKVLREFYRELLSLRRRVPALARLDKKSMKVGVLGMGNVMTLHRWSGASRIFAVLHFGAAPAQVILPLPKGRWKLILDSSSAQWEGTGGGAPERIAGPRAKLTLQPRSVLLLAGEVSRSGNRPRASRARTGTRKAS